MTKQEKKSLDFIRFWTIAAILVIIVLSFIIGIGNIKAINEFNESAVQNISELQERLTESENRVKKLQSEFNANVEVLQEFQRVYGEDRVANEVLYGNESLSLKIEEIVGKYLESSGE